jgi:hypothetical protein
VPLINIDAGKPFFGNKARKAAIIVRMGGDGFGKSLFGSVSHKQLFAGYANALTPVCSIDLCCVRLKPRPVACKPRILRPRVLLLSGVGHLFHENRRRLANHMT